MVDGRRVTVIGLVGGAYGRERPRVADSSALPQQHDGFRADIDSSLDC